jgi:serine/threonine protein kinase
MSKDEHPFMLEILSYDILGVDHVIVTPGVADILEVYSLIHLNEDGTSSLFQQMLQAVSYMHNELRIAHLNLSPNSFVVSRNGHLVLTALHHAIPVAPDTPPRCQQRWESFDINECVELLTQGVTPLGLATMLGENRPHFQAHFDRCLRMYQMVSRALFAEDGFVYEDALAEVPRFTLPPSENPECPSRDAFHPATPLFDSARAIPGAPQELRRGNTYFTGQPEESHSPCPFAEDVYALGMTMLHCLVGCTPFTAGPDALRAWTVGGIRGLLDHLRVTTLTWQIVYLLEEMLHPDPLRRPTVVQCLHRLPRVKIFWQVPEGTQVWPQPQAPPAPAREAVAVAADLGNGFRMEYEEREEAAVGREH